MIYAEKKMDLFSVPASYYFAHCISADFVLGAGIALQFNKYFNMKDLLSNHYPNYSKLYRDSKMEGDCIVEGSVLNLITKERYFHKPTMKTMAGALNKMKEICLVMGIQKVAMPMIGCGLDRLNWDDVSNLIKEIFKDTDVEILVCQWR